MSARRNLACAALASLAMAVLVAQAAYAAASAPRSPRPRPPAIAEDAPAASEAASETDAAPEEVARLPRPRPATQAPSATLAWAGAAQTQFAAARSDTTTGAANAADALAPLPRPRPDRVSANLALVPPRALRVPPVPTDPKCLADLRALGVVFTEEPAIDPLGECNVDHPLSVTMLGAGIAIEPTAILNCHTAEALARWVQTVVVPDAQARLGRSANRRRPGLKLCLPPAQQRPRREAQRAWPRQRHRHRVIPLRRARPDRCRSYGAAAEKRFEDRRSAPARATISRPCSGQAQTLRTQRTSTSTWRCAAAATVSVSWRRRLPCAVPERRSANSRHRRSPWRRRLRRRAPRAAVARAAARTRQRIDGIVQDGGKPRHHAVAHPLMHLAVRRSAEGERAIEPPGRDGGGADRDEPRAEGIEPEAV